MVVREALEIGLVFLGARHVGVRRLLDVLLQEECVDVARVVGPRHHWLVGRLDLLRAQIHPVDVPKERVLVQLFLVGGAQSLLRVPLQQLSQKQLLLRTEVVLHRHRRFHDVFQHLLAVLWLEVGRTPAKHFVK